MCLIIAKEWNRTMLGLTLPLCIAIYNMQKEHVSIMKPTLGKNCFTTTWMLQFQTNITKTLAIFQDSANLLNLNLNLRGSWDIQVVVLFFVYFYYYYYYFFFFWGGGGAEVGGWEWRGGWNLKPLTKAIAQANFLHTYNSLRRLLARLQLRPVPSGSTWSCFTSPSSISIE